MKCENYSEWISLYIDHQLKGKDLKTFKAHLNQCTSCQEEVAFLREIIKDIASLEKIVLPNGFHEQLMEKIKIKNQNKQKDTAFAKKKNKKWYLNWKVGSAVAAVFVFSLLIVEIFNMNAPKGAIPESGNMQIRSISMDEASTKMANDTAEAAKEAQEDILLDKFDLQGVESATWEIQTKEYEKCIEGILQAIGEIEGEKTVVEDTQLDDANNPQFTIEITLEKSQKDLLRSKITEICKNDTIKLQEDHVELEDGLMETIIITINQTN